MIRGGKYMIFKQLQELISSDLGLEKEEVTLDSNLAIDLGADSLDAVEIIMAIEDTFDISIPESDAQELKTIKQIVEYIKDKKK